MKINICDHEESQYVKNIRKQMDDKWKELGLSFSEDNIMKTSEENLHCSYRTPAKIFEQEKQPSKLYAFYRRNRIWFLLGLLAVSLLTTLGIIFPVQLLKLSIGIILIVGGITLWVFGTAFLGDKIKFPNQSDNFAGCLMDGVFTEFFGLVVLGIGGFIVFALYKLIELSYIFGSYIVQNL